MGKNGGVNGWDKEGTRNEEKIFVGVENVWEFDM